VAAPSQNPNELVLPLRSILDSLPPQLHARLTLTDVDVSRATISIALGKIIPQLASGVVKITFGELRQAASALFNVNEEYDSLPVVLPLNEILSRLNFNSLSRNPAQKHLNLPAEISGPFGGRGEGASISTTPPLKGTPATAPSMLIPPQPAQPAKSAPPPVAPPPPAFAPLAVNAVKPGPTAPPPPAVAQPIKPVPPPAAPLPPTFVLRAVKPESTAPPPPAVAQPFKPVPPPAAPLPPTFVPRAIKPEPTVPAPPAPAQPIKPVPPPATPPPPTFVPRAIKPEFTAPPTPPAPPTPLVPPTPMAPAIPQTPSPARNGNGHGTSYGVPAQPIIPALPRQPAVPSVPSVTKPVASQPAASESAVMLAPLGALCELWPEALRMEIVQLSLVNAQVALPVNLVEAALKRGRVTFPWRNLRSWITPPATAASVHDGLELELPLQIIAPLFLTRQGKQVPISKSPAAAAPAAPAAAAPTLPSEIPNLFFGFPQPQAPSEIPEAPVNAPAPNESSFEPNPADPGQSEFNSNFFVPGEANVAPQSDIDDTTEFRRPPETVTPPTDFSSRHTTPKEVVARAMTFRGVAGALVALPDGLTVASQIPADLNADTLAAFLPQIYGRVSQCTKELRMGELNNLNFTVGNVPWKVFRIHGVYFAAFGRVGEQLPTAQLAQLAGELDRKK
jgi:hypothetical protein